MLYNSKKYKSYLFTLFKWIELFLRLINKFIKLENLDNVAIYNKFMHKLLLVMNLISRIKWFQDYT